MRISVPVSLLLLGACSTPTPTPPADAPPVEVHTPCRARDPQKRAFFGDLHVHTSYSFDVYGFDVRVTPEQAYRFARGEPVRLPPLDAQGVGTRELRLTRPLDFVAVTDHSEFLGEVEACTVPGSAGYDSDTCKGYRVGGNQAVTNLGIRLGLVPARRAPDLCGDDGERCRGTAGEVWKREQAAANAAYDRSEACAFTSFVAYEYSGGPGLSTMHRNVIFQSDRVPHPTTFFEQPTPEGLWKELRSTCRAAGTGCDVLAIPHNPNESNGQMFRLEYPEGSSLETQRELAELRAATEPLVELYQHKGDSECMNPLSAPFGAPDEYCSFEKPRRAFSDCGDGIGSGGTTRKGCLSRRDFVRTALLDGLLEEERLGVNPLRLGFIASTDTHNGTPGAVDEEGFGGHRGLDDDTPAKQLGEGNLTPGGIEFSPGGLTGIWAEENTRPSLFAALRRREVFGTSGPRLAVRFFGGWELPAGLCGDPQLVEKAAKAGVPMGGVLPPRRSATAGPTFVLSALADAGDPRRAAVPLMLMQVVKGVVEGGKARLEVFDVAGKRDTTADVDPATCKPRGAGAMSLCAVFRDPTYRPGQRAYYYARVLENPTCRYSSYTCLALPPAERPPSCTDPTVPKTVHERAWTSPIWLSE